MLNMVIGRIENFLEAFEKKFHLQKIGFLKVGEVQSYASKSLFFEGETFFQRPLENFLCVLYMTMFNISGSLS